MATEKARPSWDEYEVEDLNDVAVQVTNRTQRTYRWASREDLLQEAWRTILDVRARKTWDPTVGVAFAGYLQKAASHTLRDMVWKSISPATLSHRQRAKCFQHTQGSEFDTQHADSPVQHVARPDETLAEFEWQTRIVNELIEVFESLDCGHLSKPVLLKGYKHERVARMYGVDVREVYRAVRYARRAIENNYALYKLWREKA